MIHHPCPVCLDGGTRQTVVLGVGYVFTPCELCRYRKALEEIADVKNATYQVHSASYVAKKALDG